MDHVRRAESDDAMTRLPPNKRLKLPGGDRLKGRGVLRPGGRCLSANALAPASGSPAA